MMAALTTARLLGCSKRAIEEVLNRFEGLEHRLEFVREIEGVLYYNDSKGTNVGSVVKSLQSFSKPVILIAGGKDKNGDLSPLRGEIRRPSQAVDSHRRGQGEDGQRTRRFDGYGDDSNP